jgi:hypothetical protein
MERGAKALSRALYLPLRMERAAQITRKHNYLFLQPQHLEHGLMRKTRMERAAKCFYSTKI